MLSGINKNLPNPPNPINPVVPTYLDPSNHVCATTTADKAFTETQCVETETNATTRTYDLTWNVPLIAAGESVTFTIPVIVAYEENNLASIDNRVTTIVDEYHDQVLTDVGDFTVVNASPPPNPTKSVIPSTATINDTVTYTIRWMAGVTMAFNDLLYSDIMPDGLELVSLGSVTCSGGCPKSAASVLKMIAGASTGWHDSVGLVVR